jgi:hypothetical protein
MTQAEVGGLYAFDWSKQDFTTGEEGLVMQRHSLDSEQGHIDFHLSNDSLYLIEVHLSPPEDGTVDALYEHYRQMYATQYKDLPVARQTYWSDGTTEARIRKEDDGVLLRFLCASAKK